MTRIRLAAIDIDRCLLDPEGELHDDTAEAFAALDGLSRQGILWTAMTRRGLGSITHIREQLHPTAGWIWVHGARARLDHWTRTATLGKLDIRTLTDRHTMALIGADVVHVHCGRIGSLLIDIDERELPMRAWEHGTDPYIQITSSLASFPIALDLLTDHIGFDRRQVAIIEPGPTELNAALHLLSNNDHVYDDQPLY